MSMDISSSSGPPLRESILKKGLIPGKIFIYWLLKNSMKVNIWQNEKH